MQKPYSVNSEAFIKQSDSALKPSVVNFASIGVTKPVASIIIVRLLLQKKNCVLLVNLTNIQLQTVLSNANKTNLQL